MYNVVIAISKITEEGTCTERNLNRNWDLDWDNRTRSVPGFSA